MFALLQRGIAPERTASELGSRAASDLTQLRRGAVSLRKVHGRSGGLELLSLPNMDAGGPTYPQRQTTKQPAPRVNASLSIAEPGLVYVDVENQGTSAIDALEVVVTYEFGSARRQVGTRLDFYTANARPERHGEGAIQPFEVRRLTLSIESEAKILVGAVLTSALFRDGSFVGDVGSRDQFLGRRKADAVELGYLLELLEQGVSMSPGAACTFLQSRIKERRTALPPPNLLRLSAEAMYKRIESALSVEDARLGVSSQNLGTPI